jgi:hypothetical protein
MECCVFSEAGKYSYHLADLRVSLKTPHLGSKLIDREYVNRMIYHAISSDPEALVPEWTFKVRPHLPLLLS